MASRVNLRLDIEVKDEVDFVRNGVRSRAAWLPPTTAPNGQRKIITLTASAYTSLAPPTGTKLLVIEFDKEPNDSLVSLTLKGPTGDTGIPIVPSSAAPKLPLVLPLSSVTNLGILSGHGSDQTIEVVFL